MNMAIQSDNSFSRKDLLGMTRNDFEGFFDEIGERPFRAKQILKWIYQFRLRDFEPMTDMPIPLRSMLAERCSIGRLSIVDSARSSDGATKFVFALDDGERIEAVHIPSAERHTACLSTQVGCSLNCRFCATGSMGFTRNLDAGEIVGQFLGIEEALGVKLTNVVFMGMGEPLMNLDAVAAATDIFSDSFALALGHRRITLSTVGIPKEIDRLLETHLKPKLAISLNAPDDALRAEIMPGAARIATIDEILEAASRYATETARWFTVEYVLLSRVNDSLDHADRLAELLSDMPCKVNLIRYNAVEGSGFRASKGKDVTYFQGYLSAAGITVTLRQSKGQSVAAACGQLVLKGK